MRKLGKRLVVLVVAIVSIQLDLFAQGVTITPDPVGLGVVGKMYSGATGSPYLYNDWTNGTVTLKDGTTYQGLNLLYDQQKDELIFSIDKNRMQTFMHPVHEFILQVANGSGAAYTEKKFRNGFASVDGANGNSFYEVLAEGKVQLLKRTTKTIVEERAPGATIATKQIKPTMRYYMTTPTGFVKIRKDKKEILAVLKDKSTEIAKFAENNNLSFKEDEDLAKLVTYYNSLN
ncbi:hypothetical protein [Rufibacter quisquiliarum]|uniref:Uncharacterized protein n=1 Tax=Rufibacter quisquiliarum TaxID=1549639 RepID=A0A839GYA4_9BACT|nr:hypothetical protein [Rufibacter quisquiliarum]MBA9079428.1 hypothetical protein [Rufibacter quisquiliarum]